MNYFSLPIGNGTAYPGMRCHCLRTCSRLALWTSGIARATRIPLVFISLCFLRTKSARDRDPQGPNPLAPGIGPNLFPGPNFLGTKILPIRRKDQIFRHQKTDQTFFQDQNFTGPKFYGTKLLRTKILRTKILPDQNIMDQNFTI